MKTLRSLALTCAVLTLVLGATASTAAELASGAVTLVAVPVGAGQVVRIMAEEVAASDFLRLMPEYPATRAESAAVANVTQAEATAYAQRLTALNRRLGLLGPMEELRLPSVSEWEAVAAAPANERASVGGLDGGGRELCRDTRSESFPARDQSGETIVHQFVAVVGRSEHTSRDEPPESAACRTWIRAEARSPVVGFRLVVAPVATP